MQSGDGGTSIIPLGDFLTAEEPVWVWDADARRILWANHAGRALWGEPSVEALRARRFSAQNKAAVRMASLARATGRQREWTETLTLAVAEGRRSVTCYMQALQVAGGRPGLIVKAVGYENSRDQGVPGTPGDVPRRDTQAPPGKSDRAALKAIAALMDTASKRERVSLPKIAKTPAQSPSDAHVSPQAVAKPKPAAAPAPLTVLAPTDEPYHLPDAMQLILRELCHELRNPLAVILGFSERIYDGAVRSQEKVQSYAGNIMESADLAMAILTDFANRVLRPGMALPPPETVEIRPTVASCVRLIAPLASQAGLKVSRSVAGNLPRLRIGERGLKQILLNVLMNAVRHQKTGGHVRVTARRGRDGAARLTVTDDGIGMTKKEIRNATGGKRPPIPAEPVPGRSGLGLPLVKRLVEGAGGTFTIESARYKGTTVAMTFPPAG